MIEREYKILFLLALFLCSAVTPTVASDLEKEQRWSQQIVDALLVGEAVEFKAGDTAFLGIYAGADEPAGRGAILLHGMGVHPDWPDVINPLRSELPSLGWATLSIQMPVLGNEAQVSEYAPLFEEAVPRIEAAVDYLRKQDIHSVVLIGHSLGASMGARYLAGADKPRIDGFVAVGMSVIDVDEQMNSALALQKIRVPVLDVYGSRDLESVLKTVDKREQAARRAGNENYRQLKIEGADHFFTGSADLLVRRVYGWLKTSFAKSTGE